MNLRKLYSFISISLIFTSILIFSNSEAQVIIPPTVQDCMGAIPVCNYVYVQPEVYHGMGNYPNEVNPNQSCPRSCMDGEENSIWYVISVKTGGLLRFSITPIVSSDDYDWAVYNLNDLECSDIYDNAQLMQKSCNAAGGAGYHGTTGISSLNGGNANCNGGGPTNKWNGDLPVQTGDTYVLCVSNWTATSSAGYTLDFSASTADIFDDVPAYVTAIDTVRGCSGSATLSFDFNENILCSSAEYSDFEITGPDGIHYPNSIVGAGCNAGGTQEKFFTLGSFYPPITQTGIYTLTMVGEVEDLCLNVSAAPPIDFYAEIDPLPTITVEPVDAMAPIGSSASFHIETIGANTFKWQIKQGLWSDLTETPPYSGTSTNTLTINPATMELGETQYRCIASGDCTPADASNTATLFVGDELMASATAVPETICIGASSVLDVNAFGGNITQPYNYEWSSPDGWNSTLETPTVEPTVTTTYTVVVDDGYNPVTVLVTVYVNPLPVVNAGVDQDIPHGTQTILEGDVTSGEPPYVYNWQPSDSLWNSSLQNPITRKLRGSCNFSLIVTDGNGCISEPDIMTVNVVGGPLSASPSIDPNVICIGDTAYLSALPSGGDTSKYVYTWTVNGVTVSTQSNFAVTPEDNTTYNLILDDGSNQVSRSVAITVNQLPVLHLIKPEYHLENNVIQLCVFDSLVVDSGFPNGEYLWDNGATSFTNTLATSGITFDYQEHFVRVTNPATHCVNSDSLAIAFTFTECTYGIKEMTLNDLIKLFPNPAGNSVTLSIDGSPERYLIQLTDLYGRILHQEEIQKSNSGILNHLIDLSSFSNCTCLLRVSSRKESVIKKLIINH